MSYHYLVVLRAASRTKKLYLITSGGKWTKFSYTDFANFPEIDIDQDGNYELIGCYLVKVNGHSYWTFDLYNLIEGRLVNVSDRFGYPIMGQYLNRENYQITKHFTREQMKKFSKNIFGDTGAYSLFIE